MSLALLCGARAVLRAGRHGVPDAGAICLWLLDRVRSSVAAAAGVDLVARAACGWRRCQRRHRVSEVLDGRDNRPSVQWSAACKQKEKAMGYALYETPMGVAGYAVEDTCHQEGCSEVIDRGWAYLCGDQPGWPSGRGCGRWFCVPHLYGRAPINLCRACRDAAEREGPE